MAQQINLGSLLEQLAQVEDAVSVNSDEDLLLYDRGYIRNHNDQYTELLEAYVDNAKKTLEQKKLYKNIFSGDVLVRWVLCCLCLLLYC